MGDFVIRLAALAGAASVVGRVALIPLARLVRRLVDEIGDVKATIDELPKLDAGLVELRNVRKSIDAGLVGMQRVVAGGEERVVVLEQWRDGHLEKHRQIDHILAAIEKRRPGR